MLVLLDGKSPKPSLPDMTAAVVVLMVATDMGRRQPHHVVAQVAITSRPEHEMEMIGHQAKCQQANIAALPGLGQEFDKSIKVALFAEDHTSIVTAIHDMVAVAARGVACSAWHAAMLAVAGRISNRNLPCPLFCVGRINAEETAWLRRMLF